MIERLVDPVARPLALAQVAEEGAVVVSRVRLDLANPLQAEVWDTLVALTSDMAHRHSENGSTPS
jgi:hypothetical protein